MAFLRLKLSPHATLCSVTIEQQITNPGELKLKGTVLIVDDQKEYARFLDTLLTRFGYRTRVVHDASDARDAMVKFCPDVILMDKDLPDADGIELVAELKKNDTTSQFIIITGHASIKSAVLSAQRGAVDYLSKPCETEEVLLAVDNALNKKHLNEEIQLLRSSSTRSSVPTSPTENAQAKSVVMKSAFAHAERAAGQKSPVLLMGENGVGKERLARWIHSHSNRGKGPFFSINLAALTPQAAELELFGHEPGVAENNHSRKKGLLELADRGSLLINEVESMALPLQARILSYLETRAILRVGGEELIPLDTRILISCRSSLDKMLAEGQFLEELYYRINLLPIHLPPLRERKGDIVPLAKEILETLASDLGLSHRPSLTRSAADRLMHYHWPGNIRELRNVLERTLMLGHELQIEGGDLPLSETDEKSWHITVSFPENETLHDVTRSVTRMLIEEALRRGHTKQEAARLLGLSRHALAHQMKAVDLKSNYKS
jgi:two-component system, NtrC family, response regulator AtoC